VIWFVRLFINIPIVMFTEVDTGSNVDHEEMDTEVCFALFAFICMSY